MRKYCRYCAFCISGDAYYCTAREKVLYDVKHVVQCAEFVLSALGDIDTGKKYVPRELRKSNVYAEEYSDYLQFTLI